MLEQEVSVISNRHSVASDRYFEFRDARKNHGKRRASRNAAARPVCEQERSF